MSVWNSIKSFFGIDSDPETNDTYGYQIELTDSGYRIIRDGSVVITQPFKPGLTGFVPFDTPEEAEAAADAAIREMIAAEQAAAAAAEEQPAE